ncbi:DUF4245 domain-containing protein [Plantibacter flavus]|uniref:DUF4245 domain-containing protein n=1 Tax=Plantibacter flavus TaxID=150123 RepID=UPI003F17A609
MNDTKAPRVVAELGRPETPQETADRKAENSRLYRARKTVNNLVLSLLATVGLVVVIVLAVPRGEAPERPNVDYALLAGQAQRDVTVPLLTPELGDDWGSNYADIRTAPSPVVGTPDIRSWNVGLIAPDDEFVGLVQGIDANDTWLAAELDDARPTGTVTIDGVEWIEYANGSGTDEGNVGYALSTVAGQSTIAVFGTATPEHIVDVARSVRSGVTANLDAATSAETDAE